MGVAVSSLYHPGGVVFNRTAAADAVAALVVFKGGA